MDLTVFPVRLTDFSAKNLLQFCFEESERISIFSESSFGVSSLISNFIFDSCSSMEFKFVAAFAAKLVFTFCVVFSDLSFSHIFILFGSSDDEEIFIGSFEVFGREVASRSNLGSRIQNPPLPGSSLVLSTLVKHLFRERLCRIEFYIKEYV